MKKGYVLMIIQAKKSDASAVSALAAQLFSSSEEELSEEFGELLDSDECAVFLLSVDGQPAGFAQCQLRHDYVEGTCSSPVGYLEGIYVLPEYRGKGCAKALLAECERWAKAKDCTEFASDCELDNTGSLAFHLNMGFTEANRIICFTKKL